MQHIRFGTCTTSVICNIQRKMLKMLKILDYRDITELAQHLFSQKFAKLFCFRYKM